MADFAEKGQTTAHELLPDMTLANTWIERGADGRPYFVRKKTKLPSSRRIQSDAFAPLRKSSSPFSRSYQRDHYIVPAPAHVPLYLPAPPSWPLGPGQLALPQPPIAPTSNPTSITMNPYDPYAQQQNDKNAENNPRGILKPTPQSYSAPFPGMYPAPPPQFSAGQHQTQLQSRHGPPYSPQHIHRQSLPFPTQPPGVGQGQPLPPGARVISPPRLPTADDLKYRCSVCGRFRSTSYHYKHPIPPGQLPGKTICRKCKEEATDSEDETASSGSCEDHRHRPRRSIGKQRESSVSTYPRRAGSRRGRSQSQVVYSEAEDYDYYQPLRERSWSRSSSVEVQPFRRGSRRRQTRHLRSPSVKEVVRYVERPVRPKFTRRVTYMEELPRRTYDYDDGDDDEYNEEQHTQRIARPPSPAPRVIRRQYSDPFIHLAHRGGHQGYLNSAPPTRECSAEWEVAPRSRSRVSLHHRVASAPFSRKEVLSDESEDDFYKRGRPTSYRRPPSRNERSRGRGESQPRFREEDRAERHRSVSVVRRASRSAEWPSAEHEDSENHHSARAARLDRDPLPVRSYRRRRTSRSQSAERSELASRLLQPGDEVTVIEHHDQNRSNDYDYYDRDGMRVRVREI